MVLRRRIKQAVSVPDEPPKRKGRRIQLVIEIETPFFPEEIGKATRMAFEKAGIKVISLEAEFKK